ncbi:hypothetical protein [Bacteroides acidifaciens]|uniref:hypothetical protein n=1 Tax=Bacteroides acidifaciens TaxID=85831 RepID=UPI00301469C7
MEQKFCQSCGTLLTDDNKGTNADGDFIVSGAQTPRISGMIMIKAENRAAVDAIIAQAPFNINGITDYRIVGLAPTMFCESTLYCLLR